MRPGLCLKKLISHLDMGVGLSLRWFVATLLRKDCLPMRTRRSRRLLGRTLAIGLVLGLAGAVAGTASASTFWPWTSGQSASGPDLGANVTVFDPSMPLADVQAALNTAYTKQVNNEMGTQRYAFLFKPGTYGTDAHPLQFKVGYYTEIAGLGLNPDDVVINGKIEVYNRCLDNGGTTNCVALDNFWRTVGNLKLHVNGAGQDTCHATANIFAVSQAVSLRRLDIDGKASLMDYCSAGPQYASGGFIADSKASTITSGSQQQWLTRNSELAPKGWSNAVWNQVFSGVVNAPSEADFPKTPYTTLDKTPISREKPFLYVDAKGRWNVRVPNAHHNTSGTSWAADATDGRSIPLRDFYVAKPSDPIRAIDRALARGQNLLLTPGVYNADRSIQVNRPNQVLLGIGQATLTSVGGATPIVVGNVPGAIVAGVTVDAGLKQSKALIQVGSKHSWGHTSAANPTTLSDVFFRVGGPHVGKTDVALEVNSNNVLVDHTWVWRADHGDEGFTGGDTERWKTNVGNNGVVVNGDNVTATGLFVEHFQKNNVVWNGNGGTTIFFQNELPYDPPTQADWMDGTKLGYAAYKVAANVRTNHLYGGGAYVYNRNNPAIHTANGFEVPNRPGVQLHHIMTVNLDAGTLDHVVNGIGAPVAKADVGVPSDIVDYPAKP